MQIMTYIWESVNIVPTLKKTEFNKIHICDNFVFIWYKVKNISQTQAQKYLSNQVKSFPFHIETTLKSQHINILIVFCIHYSINWSANVLQGINISACIWMPFRKIYSFAQNLQPTQSNYASQLILLCAFGEVYMLWRSCNNDWYVINTQ
jgi:hypothetical protein